jgi:predicted RNA-binding Zn-ribbon protein involved in translation (DUF1610 family)
MEAADMKKNGDIMECPSCGREGIEVDDDYWICTHCGGQQIWKKK